MTLMVMGSDLLSLMDPEVLLIQVHRRCHVH